MIDATLICLEQNKMAASNFPQNFAGKKRELLKIEKQQNSVHQQKKKIFKEYLKDENDNFEEFDILIDKM